MKLTRGFLITLIVVVVGMVMFRLSTSTGQTDRRYEVETKVYSTPEYRTDTTRAIEAYERVMERYMDVAERNFLTIATDLRTVSGKLDAIDEKLTRLDMRLERIERHLGILPSLADPNAASAPAPVPGAAPAATSPQPVRPTGQLYR